MARKQLNKSVVVVLTLFGFLGMIVASALMLRNLRNVDPQHFAALAEQYAAKSQFREAAMFYQKAWQVSQDAAFLVPLGEMLLSEGEVGGALQSWSQALVKQPDLLSAHRRRVSLMLDIGRLYNSPEDWRRVLEGADALAAFTGEIPPPDRALALHARGMARTSLAASDPANTENGLADLAEAHRLAPDELDYALELARRQAVTGKAAEGEKLFRELLAQHATAGPSAAQVRVAYAEYLSQNREASTAKLQEAETLFQEARKLAENNAEVMFDADLAYAGFLFQRWQRVATAKSADTGDAFLTQSEEILKKCIDAHPQRFEAYLQLTTLYRVRQRHEEIASLCEKRLTQGFSRKGIQAAKEKLQVLQLMITASEACLSQAVRTDQPVDPAAKDGWLKRAQQFADDAAGEFRGHPRVLSQFGRIKLAQGKDREALADLRKADEGYRTSDVIDWENKLILARLHLRLQEPGAAKQVLDEVIGHISGPAGIPFWNLHAQILLLNNDLENPQLARAIAEIQRFEPDNTDAKRLQATIYERQGKLELAREIIERIAPAAGLTTMATLLRARERFLDGDAESAIQILLADLKKNPGDALLVSTTAQELMARQRGEEARAIVAAARKEKPDDRRLEQLAIAVRADLTPEQRRDGLRAVIESEPDSFQRHWNLAEFWMRERDDRQALAALNEAEKHWIARDTPAASEASTTQLRELLKAKLLTAGRLKDDAAMAEARDTAIKLDIDGAKGQTLLGMYHMLRSEYDAAILAWRAALDQQPTHTRSLASLAQCLHQTGELDEAKSWYERALQINPQEAAAHRGLAMLARERGDPSAYTRHLSECERLIPKDPWVASELLLRQEQADPQGAIARRETELQEKPDDFANLTRLAFLSETVKDTNRADRYYEHLLSLRPDDRDLIVQLGKYYRRTRRPERALELTRRFAESQTTPDAQADAWILVAAHYLSTDDLPSVEKTLLQAANLAETFEITHSLGEFYLRKADRPDQALPWYDKAVALAQKDRLPKLSAVLASRIACALGRGVDDRDKARSYIEAFRREYPDDPRSALWESDLHVREGRIDESVAALSRYLAQRPNDALALFQRARLSATLGRIPSAIEDLESIRRVNPRALQFEPRLLLAQLHEHSGRPDQALRELESLQADAPNTAAPLEALIQAYIRAGRLADADRTVTAQINRTDVPADWRWYFLRARVLAGLKDPARAIADMHRGAELAGSAPDRLADVLEFYAQVERFADGVAYFQTHASAGNRTPRLLSRYAVLLARAGKNADAVAAFREAMELAAADSGDAIRGVTADLRVAFPDAAAAAELFERSPPDGAAARANERILIRLYRAADRVSKAVARLEKLVATAESERDRAELQLELGEMHQVSGALVPARAAFEQALAHDPKNWIVMNNLAYLLSDQLGEHQAALPHARAAVRLMESADTLDTLGWIYVHLEQYRAAIAELSRAVQLSDAQSLIYYHLGEAYRRNRQFDDALDVFRTGRNLAQAAKDASTLALLESGLKLAESRSSDLPAP